MPQPLPVRGLTGLTRRKAKRDATDYSRNMALSHKMVGLRDSIQRGMVMTFVDAEAAFDMITPLVALIMILVHNGHHEHAMAAVTVLEIKVREYQFNTNMFEALFRMDHEYFDIPAEVIANRTTLRLLWQYIRIEDWSDEECYQFTSFTQDQLYEIYGQFGLEEVAEAEPHIGYIAIHSHGNHHHLFPPQELFLFFMTRMHTGDNKKKLCLTLFGGHASPWSRAINWIMKYLDDRYERTISHRKLEDYVDDFPEFFNKISGFMQKDSVQYYPDGDEVEKDGLNFCPLPIFGFIDCSIDKICRPFSGPDGDYIGACRKMMEDIYQRSVYTGYKKIHGIKVETVLLANGIMTIFGPVSARIHDVGGVLLMSQLDNFLAAIQEGKESMYMAFGDGAYNSQHLICIRSYFAPIVPGEELTDKEKLCNRRLKTVRQTIEHCYGDIETIFRICTRSDSVKLGLKAADGTCAALRQLRLCHLLMNIYACLNGNKANSYAKFNCRPPKLEDYLAL